MEGLNRVMLFGNLGADPDLRFTAAGQAVLHLRMATTESYLDKDKVRQQRTDWHNVVVWGKRGEALAKILGKGSSLFVEGSLRTSSYDDRETGKKVYKTEIVASNVILGGRGNGGGSDDGHEENQDAEPPRDRERRQEQPRGGRPQSQASSALARPAPAPRRGESRGPI